MIIRPAKISDSAAIQLLLDQLGYPIFDEQEVVEKINLHQQPGYCILIAEIENKVVGFISMHWFELMHWKGRLGRFTSFCIDEMFRSKGVGQALLKEGEAFLIKQGCVKLEVTSNLKRTRTHEFYLKAGYVEDSRRFVKVLAAKS
ncbi:MAG: GNAT family N-acetyltransferase [Chitinophagales bacterium]